MALVQARAALAPAPSRDAHPTRRLPSPPPQTKKTNSLGVDARVALMAANEVAQVLEGDAWRHGVAAAQSDVVDAV